MAGVAVVLIGEMSKVRLRSTVKLSMNALTPCDFRALQSGFDVAAREVRDGTYRTESRYRSRLDAYRRHRLCVHTHPIIYWTIHYVLNGGNQ